MSAIDQVLVVQIENTAYCNRKCPWCPQSHMKVDAKQMMTWKTLRRIVEELVKVNYRNRIHPYGNGEPLTDLEFVEKVRYIRRKLTNCFMYMATNGDYIDKPNSFSDLFEAGVDSIQCNHYDDQNEHLKHTMVNMTIKRNGRYHQVGIDHIDLGDLRTTFYNRAGNIKLSNISPSPSCWFPGRKLYFNYLGDMLICCADWTFKDKVGNINEQSLSELLQSPKLQQYKDCLSKGRTHELPLCSQCNLIRHQEAI